jgi:hypothetical protein
MRKRNIDPNLLEYCTTDRQREIIQAAIDSTSQRDAAQKLGVAHSLITATIARAEARAARAGYSPEHDMTRTVPDGFHVRGTSTLYDADGNQKIQWVKSSIDHERQRELMRAAIEALKGEIVPAMPVASPQNTLSVNLLNQYTITDFHIGMYAWSEETGDDPWDTDIAERLLMAWFDRAIELAPDSDTAVFAQIGDFLHWDGMDAVTPASKHILDADTRFGKLVRVSIRVIRYCIAKLLTKHQSVHVLMADANHDPASEVWLRELLAAFYENEPRVTVDNSADSYYCVEWGETSLFYHHGHKRKPENIDNVFVAKYREVFGRTKYSYAHMGHMHHNFMKETNLMSVEQHRTLASRDAYASRGGYMSGRDAKVITYHKQYGEVSRLTISPDMLLS